MIKIKYTDTSLTLSGHADYDKYGKDIVCASVSTLVTSTINHIHSISETIDYQDDGNILSFRINNDKYSKILFNNLILMLKELANDYPKNIKIESEK